MRKHLRGIPDMERIINLIPRRFPEIWKYEDGIKRRELRIIKTSKEVARGLR